MFASGIYQKIEKDIKTSTAYKEYFDVFWAPEQLQSNKPFTIQHSIPALIVLGLGLPSAMFFFVLELLGHLYQKKMPSKGSSLMSKDQHRGMEIRRKSNECISCHGNLEDDESRPYQSVKHEIVDQVEGEMEIIP